MLRTRHGLTERFDRTALRALLALPSRVQRLLAGRPVVIDGQTLAVETQLMLRVRALVRGRPIEQLPLEDARRELRHQQLVVGSGLPVGSVDEIEVAGLPSRLYHPTDAPDVGPLLVFFHGGGWIYGDLDSHDPICRFLAEQAGVRVLSVGYRLAPEHPFPAAYDDCVAAFAWVSEHAGELGADPGRVGVGGDSAGGNLAAGVALAAAERGWPVAFQLLLYPVTDARGGTRSRDLFGEGFVLTGDFMDLARDHYLPDRAQWEDPRVSPVLAEIPPGLAPAYVATAGFDPLRDEGEAYAQRMADAGVPVEHVRFRDQIHGFMHLVSVGRTALAANRVIAERLRVGLGG